MGAGNPLLRNYNKDTVDTYFIDMYEYFNIVNGKTELEDIEWEEIIDELICLASNISLNNIPTDKYSSILASGFRSNAYIIAQNDNFSLITCLSDIMHTAFSIIPNTTNETLAENIQIDINNILDDINMYNYNIELCEIQNDDIIVNTLYSKHVEISNKLLLTFLAYIYIDLGKNIDNFNKIISIRNGAWMSSTLSDELINEIINFSKYI